MDDVQIVRGPLGSRADGVAAIAEQAGRVDGVEPLSEQFRLGLHGPGPHLVWADGAGDVAAYAGIVTAPGGGPAAVEAVVAPSARGHGRGRILVRAALDVAGAEATVWAHGDLPAARAVASALKLIPARTLLQLRRSLAGLDAAPEPATGVVVRTYAGPSDDRALLAVNNAAFAWHPEQGGWGQEQIDERVHSDWFDPAGLFLAVTDGAGSDGGRLLGFHWTKVHPATADAPALGEVYIVGVAPEGQGRGLGRLLTAVGLHHLAGQGLGEVALYVEGDNDAALRTYTGLGFTEYRRDVAYRAGAITI